MKCEHSIRGSGLGYTSLVMDGGGGAADGSEERGGWVAAIAQLGLGTTSHSRLAVKFSFFSGSLRRAKYWYLAKH